MSRALRGLLLAAILVASLAGLSAATVPAQVPDSASDGPSPVGFRDVTVEVGEHSFSARIHYPAAPGTSGRDAPRAAGRFPVIVFGHGYLGIVERYESTLRPLATWGFIVVAPRSAGELLPDHSGYAHDFGRVLDWIEAQDATPGSWLEGAVLRGAYGASGHSMGGGASLLAAAHDPRVRTVANLAAAETDPSAIAVMGSISAPVLLIAGSEDTLAPIARNQRPMFEAKTDGQAQLRVIAGGYHCGFMDPDPILSLACDRGSLDATTQLAFTRRLLTDWFRHQLLGDADLESTVWPRAGDAQVSLEAKGGPEPEARAHEAPWPGRTA